MINKMLFLAIFAVILFLLGNFKTTIDYFIMMYNIVLSTLIAYLVSLYI